MIYIGTSGWQYRHWKERFYPKAVPQKAWLPYFADRFATVEINNSFYMLPQPSSFERWRDSVPDGFVYAVKANRYITHIKRMRDPETAVGNFLERARLLGDKLGPILYQFPPRFGAEIERLTEFLRALPDEPRGAFEFRDDSWNTDAVRALLDEKGYAWVLPDRPGTRFDPVVTGRWSYIRFHQGRRTGPWYPRRKLATWAERIGELPAEDVYIYFNNDPEGAAIRDAETMTELLSDMGLSVRGAGWRGEVSTT